MPIKFSTGLPNCREGRQNTIGSVTIEGMLQVARAADELGYYSLWPNEFYATFPDLQKRYVDPPNLYDTIITMAYVMAETKRVRVTPSTIVLPLHDPLSLGRQLATLDVFSGGRVTLGIGLGGSAEEYRSFHGEMERPNRGKMMDEYIPALRTLWTERKATFQGQYVNFTDVETFPKPVQQPLPICTAGHAEGVLKRLVTHCQGWIDSSMPPEELGTYITKIGGLLADAGRGDEPFEYSRQFYVSIAPTEEEAKANFAASVPPPTHPDFVDSGPRLGRSGGPTERNLIGTPEQIRERLKEYVAVGATEICVIFFSSSGDGAEKQVRLFAEQVMPAFA